MPDPDTRSFIAVSPDEFPPLPRPPCPECGGNQIQSHGGAWLCVDCGRKFVKHCRLRVADNPPCYACGARTHKMGINYVCTECGRARRVRLR